MDDSKKPVSLKDYIQQIATTIKDTDTQLFESAIKNFQNYCQELVNNDHDVSMNSYKVDGIYNEIGNYATENPLLHVTLLYSILEIPLGDKTNKANKIARQLLNISPSKDANVWVLFEKILLWEFSVLKNSFALTLQPLRDLAITWISGEETEPRYSGFRLLTILITDFPTLLESFMNHCIAVVAKSFKEIEPECFNEAGRSLRALLQVDNDFHPEVIRMLMKPFNSQKTQQYIGVSYALDILLNDYPQDAKYAKFKSIPMESFQQKDPTQRNNIYPILPLIYRTTPELFSEDTLISIYKTYESFLKKKTAGRAEALVGFANFLLARGIENVSNAELTQLQKCKKEIIEMVDSSECSSALIAVDLHFPDQFQNDLPKIFSYIYEKNNWHYLKKYIEIRPQKSKILYSTVLSSANKWLLSLSSTVDLIIINFELLKEIQIPTSFFSTPLILEYSLHASSTSREVREKCMQFLLDYQKNCPTIEIAVKLLANIAMEPNSQLRRTSLQNLYLKEIDLAVVQILESLLHDMDQVIRITSFGILIRFANIKSVPQILSNYLMEKVKILQHSDVFSREDIEIFNIIAAHSFSVKNEEQSPSEQSARQILLPFAQFLIKHLIGSKKRLSASALKLLASLLPLASQNVNTTLLCQHIGNALLIHSSRTKLDAALDLFEAALIHTDIQFQLSGEQSSLFFKLLVISRLPKQTAKDFMQQQNENIMQPSNQQKFAYTRKPQMKPGIIKAPMMAPSSRFSRLSTLKYVY